MKHLTDEQLSAHLDGALAGRAADEAERHLAGCPSCQEALAGMAARDEALRPALTHDPGDAYFERFAARVEERIAAGAAPERPRRGFDPGGLFRSPRALAWAGAAAVVVVAGGLALMTSREVMPPDLRERRPAARVERAAEPAAGAGGQAAPPAAPAPTPPAAALPAPMSEAALSADRAPADEAATGPAADARRAAPGRAHEVRLNEAGEAVPVRRPAEARVAPPVAPPADRDADPSAQARKKLLAEPLDAAAKAAPARSLGATGAREEAAPGPLLPSAGTGAAAEVRLCGEVRDAADRPIAGAQVALAGLGRTATTGADGRFCLSAPRGEHTLSVMAVGYAAARRTVDLAGDLADARVTLAVVPVLEGGVHGERAPGEPGPAAPRADAPAEPQDGFSALPDTLRRPVREAQRLAADAAARPSAARHELAAAAWARALRRLPEGPHEVEARRRLGEARFRAWELDPNPRRARAAVEALTAYIVRAPAGRERAEAARLLDRVGP